MDHGRSGGVDLSPQIGNVELEVATAPVVAGPEVVHDVVFGYNVPGVLHEQLQDGALSLRQGDPVVAPAGMKPSGPQAQVPDREFRVTA
jgi:hypothetical protein